MNKNAGKNNVPLFSKILDYYSTTDKYIRNMFFPPYSSQNASRNSSIFSVLTSTRRFIL